MSAAMTQKDGLAVLGILIVVMKQFCHTAAIHNHKKVIGVNLTLISWNIFEHFSDHLSPTFPRQVRRQTRRLTTSSTI